MVAWGTGGGIRFDGIRPKEPLPLSGAGGTGVMTRGRDDGPGRTGKSEEDGARWLPELDAEGARDATAGGTEGTGAGGTGAWCPWPWAGGGSVPPAARWSAQ